MQASGGRAGRGREWLGFWREEAEGRGGSSLCVVGKAQRRGGMGARGWASRMRCPYWTAPDGTPVASPSARTPLSPSFLPAIPIPRLPLPLPPPRSPPAPPSHSYQTLRRDGRERKVVMATPRQLESLIRIAESLARMRLDAHVRRDDVAEAVRLWYGAMAGSTSGGAGGGDGRPDLDTLYTGTTAAQREAARALPEELRAFFQSECGGVVMERVSVCVCVC